MLAAITVSGKGFPQPTSAAAPLLHSTPKLGPFCRRRRRRQQRSERPGAARKSERMPELHAEASRFETTLVEHHPFPVAHWRLRSI
jgi:hypothetical protein